ncbi:ECF transporter S component [Butyrivibrio sp. NC3005]|uniref:ECF transporter S component n=1 Tax=Butyrivibrio sp. NC3005 TaxID=1280685 RepID=UPI00040408B1|nr:ECF transporter S component [Butyrivibrio sp. NC3005]
MAQVNNATLEQAATHENSETVRKIAFAAVFAALTYVVFTFLSIPIPVPGGQVSVHLGNAFVALGALLLGSLYGGLGGAIGLTIGDLINPAYLPEAPITFIIKLLLGILVGIVAHKFGKITRINDSKKITFWTTIAALSGMIFNSVADPLLRYFYKILILGKPAAEVSFAINLGVTILNSVVSLIIIVALYLALRVPLKKAGLFFKL